MEEQIKKLQESIAQYSYRALEPKTYILNKEQNFKIGLPIAQGAIKIDGKGAERRDDSITLGYDKSGYVYEYGKYHHTPVIFKGMTINSVAVSKPKGDDHVAKANARKVKSIKDHSQPISQALQVNGKSFHISTYFIQGKRPEITVHINKAFGKVVLLAYFFFGKNTPFDQADFYELLNALGTLENIDPKGKNSLA